MRSTRRDACAGGLSVAALTLITGCASHSTKPLSRVLPPALAQQKAASFGQVAKLAGDWRVADDNGAITEWEDAATTRFEVSSGGEVIREIMFVGHPMR